MLPVMLICWQKVKLMDHRLEKIQANRAQNDFRIHVAANLNKIELKFDELQGNLERLVCAQLESQKQVELLAQIIVQQRSQISSTNSQNHINPEPKFDPNSTVINFDKNIPQSSNLQRRPSF